MNINLTNEWATLLDSEFKKEYFTKLNKFLNDELISNTIYPPQDEIFSAFRWTSYSEIKVVILGQDPYHGVGQAHGLCFSVLPGIRIPPSLLNIYKEMNADLGCPIPDHGYLRKWAEQGVLMLNAVLTVRDGQANSHQKKGWEQLTDQIIDFVNQKDEPVVFLLWGKNARSKTKLITNPIHKIIESAHPSPLSAYRGFLGSMPFSRTNAFLISSGEKPIDWCIDPITKI
jgi:uracil-DNA glycosylase